LDVCFQITVVSDVCSDSEVSVLLKTNIWLQSDCKNQFVAEVAILLILCSILDVILESLGIIVAPLGDHCGFLGLKQGMVFSLMSVRVLGGAQGRKPTQEV
jgi:hypothetical protein